MYAQLGNIVFEALIGFSDFERTMEASLPQHDLINSKPRLAHTGTELQEISATISFHIDFCKPEDEIKNLQDALDNASIMPLVYGNGRLVGYFVVATLKEKPQQTTKLGSFILVHVEITLKEANVEDKSALKQQAAQNNALALQQNNPVAVRGNLPQNLTDGGNLAIATNRSISEGAQTNSLIQRAINDPSTFAKTSQLVLQSIQNNQSGLDVINDVLTGRTDILGIIPGMPASVSSVSTALVNLGALMPITGGNLNSVIAANTFLQGALGAMGKTVTPLTVLNTLRRI
jgi:phage protein U